MAEEINMSEVVDEVKNASEDELKKVIEEHFEAVSTQGMKIGATYIAAAVMGKFKKHLEKPGKTSLRDYERCVADIKKMLAVQLTQQNDLKEVTEEIENDGTAEQNDNTNS
jgi:uncharacterized protein YpuA (DUF1002 family)